MRPWQTCLRGSGGTDPAPEVQGCLSGMPIKGPGISGRCSRGTVMKDSGWNFRHRGLALATIGLHGSLWSGQAIVCCWWLSF